MTRAATVAAVGVLVVAAAVVAPTVATPASATSDGVIEHDGDELTLAAAGGQVIRGDTTLSPGSEVIIRIRSTGSVDEYFVYRRIVSVGSDGRFRAVFDLGTADPGDEFTVAVRGPDGERLVDRLPGTVVEGDVDLGLPDSTVSVQRGGTSTLSIHLDQNADATFAILGREVGYRLVGTVSDGDGDGVVDVRFDTAVAGTDGDPLSVGDPADEVTLESETRLDSVLPAGRYAVLLGIDGAGQSVTATPTTTATPTEPPTRNGHPELSPRDISVLRARTGELSVVLGNASVATLSIGGPDVNYVVDATVRDGNGDGAVDVQFDTSAPGRERPTLVAAADADEVTVTNETDFRAPRTLAPGDYPVRLFRGDDVTGPVVSTATVDIEALTAGIEEADVYIGALTVEGAAPTATATPTPAEPPARSGHPELSPTIVTVPAGWSGELTVTLGNASAATLSVSGQDEDYVVDATVRDRDGDNAVTVLFDTGAAGTDTPTLSARGDDEVTVASESPVDAPPLDAGQYQVSLYRGDVASGTVVDVGTIILEDRTPMPTRSTPTLTASTQTPTVSPPGGLPASPGVFVLGGIAVLGLGAAAVLSRRR